MFPADVNLGIGTWEWGDRLIWDYGRNYRKEDLFASFKRCLNDGIRFFSTSPAFAEGISEQILGEFNAQTPVDLLIATKYVPRVWHVRRTDFMDSLKQSLLRLKLNKIDIYEICPPSGRMTVTRLAESSAEALDLGLVIDFVKKDVEIYGEPGSAAQASAEKRGFVFRAGRIPDEPLSAFSI